MAVGRQDYQAGVVPVKSGYSLIQTSFYEGDTVTLADGANDVICSYVVAVGYQLNVSGVRISCNWPGIQRAIYKLGLNYETERYYDMLLMDNFPSPTPLVCNTSELVTLHIYNDTGQTVIYFGEIFGYLEQIES